MNAPPPAQSTAEAARASGLGICSPRASAVGVSILWAAVLEGWARFDE